MPASTEAPRGGSAPHARDALATVGVLLALGAATVALSWPRGADEARCRAVFDRWAEHRIQQAEPQLAPDELERRKERARERAERGDAFARCVRSADRAALECGERAGGIDELERCFP